MEDKEAMEELVRQIEHFRQKPGFSRQDILKTIRDQFNDDEECELFITTAITGIHAEEQIREYKEFREDGIDMELFWNTKLDDLVCDECRSRDAEPGAWDDSPPPLHNGCRCWLSMRIRR